MTFGYGFAPQFQRNFKRLTKKDPVLRERILKKIEEISENPDIGEHLSGKLAGIQSVHVGHWVIVYEVFKKYNQIIFYNFDHHHHAYRKL